MRLCFLRLTFKTVYRVSRVLGKADAYVAIGKRQVRRFV